MDLMSPGRLASGIALFLSGLPFPVALAYVVLSLVVPLLVWRAGRRLLHKHRVGFVEYWDGVWFIFAVVYSVVAVLMLFMFFHARSG